MLSPFTMMNLTTAEMNMWLRFTFPQELLEDILGWAFKALPDEILVGLDVSMERNLPEVEVEFEEVIRRKTCLQGKATESMKQRWLTVVILFLFITYLKNGQTKYSVVIEALGLDVLLTGYTPIQTALLFPHADADADAQSTDGVDLILRNRILS